MKEYVLVIKEKKGLRIGRKMYTKKEAVDRLDAVRLVGINNMEIMHINKALGI